MSIRTQLRILLSITGLWATALSVAQNQPVDFSGPMSDEYDEVYRLRFTDMGLRKADSLYNVAQGREDKQAETMFLTIPVEYYSEKADSASMAEACAKLRRVARANNMPELYYWSYARECYYDVRKRNLYDALDVVHKMRVEAQDEHSDYGIFSSYVLVGDIYRIRDDMGLAKDSYERALKYQREHLPDVDNGLLCAHLSEYYRRKSGRDAEDLNHAKELVHMGLASTRDDYTRARLLSEKALIEYSVGDWEAFDDTYAVFAELIDRIGMKSDFLQLMYRHLIHDGKYNEALELINTMPNDYERHIALYVMYRSQHEYDKALREYEFANHALNAVREQERLGDLSELNSRIGNIELENRNRSLERNRNRVIGIITGCVVLTVLIFLILVMRLMRKYKTLSKELTIRNRQLAEARDKAIESEKLKTQFLQNMSHEIRTPLNAVAGFTELLFTSAEGEYGADEKEVFVNQVRRNSELLTGLVNDILTISDLESGTYKVDNTAVNVRQLCIDVIHAVSHRAKPGVVIERQTNLPDDYTIVTDEARLTQLLNNLMVNACKYTDEGIIRLQAYIVDDKTIALAVCDTGVGIDPERAEDIFNRFTKLDNFHQGTGLGLNICRNIADLLGGKVYLDTTYKAGSRFVFEVPTGNDE